MTGITTFEAGLLIRGHVRRELERAKFLGLLDEYRELKGILSSEFLIRNARHGLTFWLKRVEQELATG